MVVGSGIASEVTVHSTAEVMHIDYDAALLDVPSSKLVSTTIQFPRQSYSLT